MIKTTKSFLRFWIWPILYVLFIFSLSSLSISAVEKVNISYLDKIVHFIEYALLSYLFFRAFKNTTSLEYKRIFLFILMIGLLVAAADEYYQSFVPLRQSSILDFVFDGFGVLMGMIIFRKIKPW